MRRPTPFRRAVLTLAGAALLAALVPGCTTMSERAALNRGNRAYTAGEYEKAIAEYEKIFRTSPDHWEARYLTALCYMGLYHPGSTHAKDAEYLEQAVKAFETTLKLRAPSQESLDKTRGYYLSLLASADLHEKALAYLVRLQERDPDNIALMAQVASLYAKVGDFPNALKFYEMRANAEPAAKEGWYTIGVLCWDRSYNRAMLMSGPEREQVIATGLQGLERALELDPNYFEALSYINLMYREKEKYLSSVGQPEEARQAYLKAEEYMQRALAVRRQQLGQPDPVVPGSTAPAAATPTPEA
jgi:tetratricopeptide (TPR) repeat protein